MVSINDCDSFINRIARRRPSYVLEALQVGKPCQKLKNPDFDNLFSYQLRKMEEMLDAFASRISKPRLNWTDKILIYLGYASDNKATAAKLDSEGWLRTGDLCFSEDGFLYIVDRLEELIKYKGYQLAPYKKVCRVAFIRAIPQSPTGKILWWELVQHALSVGASKL